jgi:hypothetical protein
MASLRSLAISLLRLDGHADIAAANRSQPADQVRHAHRHGSQNHAHAWYLNLPVTSGTA